MCSEGITHILKRLDKGVCLVPVVINADLIIEELHFLCTDLMNAAAPVTCGQAIDVPDFMAYKDGFFPIGTLPGSLLLGITAAKMPTPGAITSGWTTNFS